MDTPIDKENTVNLSFTSGKPQLKSESKTAWNGTTIVWSSSDKILVGYTLDGAWRGADGTTSGAKLYESEDVSIDKTNGSIGTFTVPSKFVDPATEGEYVFYSFYPSSAGPFSSGDAPTSATYTLPTIQTPLASTFDPSADLMMGKSEAATLSGLPTDPIEIYWTRQVAHADLTFTNLALDGTETIRYITITATDNNKLAGAVDVNFPSYSFTPASSASKFVSMAGTNLTVNGNSVEAWCCIFPVTLTAMDVEIVTDKATYTRSITGISKTFKKNARNRLTINMSTAEREEIVYTLVTDYSELTEGSEVLIVRNKPVCYAMATFAYTTGGSNFRGAVDVTENLAEDINLLKNPSDAVQRFELVKSTKYDDYFMFKAINGNYPGYYLSATGATTQVLTLVSSTSSYVTNGFSSYSAAFRSDAGKTNVKVFGNKAVKTSHYNLGNGSNPNFRMRSESGYEDIALYKRSGTGIGGDQLVVTVQADPRIIFTGGVSTDSYVANYGGGQTLPNFSATYTVSYRIDYPVSGRVLTAVSNKDWIHVDTSTDGQVKVTVDANETGSMRGGTVTLQYTGAPSRILVVGQLGS